MIYDIHYLVTDKRYPLQARIIGIDYSQEPVNRPSGLPFSQWFYCVKGKGEFIINHQRMILSEGQGGFILANVPHSYCGLTEDWTVDFIAFDGSACNEILQSLNMLESGVYNFRDKDFFVANMLKMETVRNLKKSQQKEEYSKLFYGFLLELEKNTSRILHPELVEENEMVGQIAAYLDENYGAAISLDDLAGVFGYTKEYMCTSFKKNTGHTIMKYLMRIRISRARFLLAQYPDKSVAEIGRMCGFETASYFGVVFKKEVGVTPDYYRKN